jgi:D-alanyl-D-alanine carboxypeptidase/D-alanyl-D-alanine-endopeptidase (penicillin-binding protein 4)
MPTHRRRPAPASPSARASRRQDPERRKDQPLAGDLPALVAAIVLSAAPLPGTAAEPTATEAASGIPVPVAKQMRDLQIAPQDVSFYVQEIARDKPVLAFNADVPRNPASCIKLLTTAAGLDVLGPDYRWQTRAYATGKAQNGRLAGDLIIKGLGDPSLAAEDLWRLLWGVRERGIETIGGDLVLDASYFAPPGQGRGDFDGNATSPYNALPHALSVNAQATRVHLLRDELDGVRVFTDPPLANLAIESRLRLIEAPCQSKHHKPVLRVLEQAASVTLRVSGTFAADCGESDYARLLLTPEQHTAGAVLALWQAMGGRIEGSVLDGVAPAGARLLYTLRSDPLEDAVRLINKRSDNLVSRTLFLTLGAERQGAPGTPEKALSTIAEWLRSRGLTLPELVVDNGSGLSRDTRISARGMGLLLGYAYTAPIMPQFLSSLAIAGVDGTMRKRFRQGPLKGRAHVKTGTLRGVSAAAGYVLDRGNRRWVVVSLINNPRLQAWRAKGVENTLIEWVHDAAGAEGAGHAKRAALN